MKIKRNFGYTYANIEQLTTLKEQQILESSLVYTDIDEQYTHILKLLGIHKYKNDAVRLALLYEIRNSSIGPDLNITYKCDGCRQIVQTAVSLDDTVFIPIDNCDNSLYPKLTNTYKLKTLTNVSSIDAYKFFNAETPKTVIALKHYDTALKLALPHVKQHIECSCMFCRHIRQINLHDKKFAIQSLSEHTLKSLYTQINNMVVEGFAVNDILKMLQFERETHYTLLLKRAKEFAQNSQT